MEPELLLRLRARFEGRRPIRAGSLIVTLYGDALAPRGGSLWLGSLNTLVEPFGIEPGLVRTAMSRLVTDGWFERSRDGKKSFYRLSTHGEAELAAAGSQIYAAADPPWTGRMEIVVLTTEDAKSRQGQREGLAALGFGQLASNVMLRPLPASGSSVAAAQSPTAEISLCAHDVRTAEARQLVTTGWSLDALADAYRQLHGDIAPRTGRIDALDRISDAAAFQIRVLLIHEWRRIVLRDPRLPAELLPDDWPGARARQSVAQIYRACWPGCERWLDSNAIDERGPLRPAERKTRSRFMGADYYVT